MRDFLKQDTYNYNSFCLLVHENLNILDAITAVSIHCYLRQNMNLNVL